MKVFQIFDRPLPPKAPYLGFMERARDLAESYTLIAPQNFMGAGFVPFSEVWEALPEYLRKNTNGPLMAFDAMRCLYLSQHFDHVYLDIDVELIQPLGLMDKPQKAGPGVLVGNGDPVLGAACWQNYLRMCPQFCRPASLIFSGVDHCEAPADRFHHHYAKGAYT